MKRYDYSPMALPFVAKKRNIPGNISKFPGISPTQLSQVMKMRCEEGLKKYGVIISGGFCARLPVRCRDGIHPVSVRTTSFGVAFRW